MSLNRAPGLRRVATAVAMSLAVASVMSSVARAQQTPSRLDATGVRVEGETLTASVVVLDGASNPVAGLTAADFKAQVDGRSLTPTRVDTGVNAALPIGIVLAVDTSGSMAGAAIASARQALLPLVSSLQPTDAATLITFAGTVATPVPSTSDQGRLSTAVQAMQASGNTALFAGVTQAATSATQQAQPRKAVVLLSDGEDFGTASGGITRDQALATARTAGVPFFVVGLGQEIDQQFLTSLARDTGGQYFAAASPAELAQLYGRISDRLRQQYTITVALPAGLAPGEHRVGFTVGTVSVQTTFTVAETKVPVAARFEGLPSSLTEPVVVELVQAPANMAIRFELDGHEIEPEADGRSVTLDPYDLEARGGHTLTTRNEADTSTVLANASFDVPALPPQLLEPVSLPNLVPGDLVRVSVRAQPGPLEVEWVVDDRSAEVDRSAPFEFVLPDGDYESGAHELKVVVSGAGGQATRSFEFEGAPAQDSNMAAMLLLALLTVVLVASTVAGARLGFARLQERRAREPVVIDMPDRVSRALDRRGGKEPGDESWQPVVEWSGARAWGKLTVVEGPDAGRSFDLSDETELVGRADYCSIRLTDRTVQDAHFVISRDGRLTASTPAASVTIDGTQLKSARLSGGGDIRIGATVLRLERIEAGEESALGVDPSA